MLDFIEAPCLREPRYGYAARATRVAVVADVATRAIDVERHAHGSPRAAACCLFAFFRRLIFTPLRHYFISLPADAADYADADADAAAAADTAMIDAYPPRLMPPCYATLSIDAAIITPAFHFRHFCHRFFFAMLLFRACRFRRHYACFIIY